MKPSKTLFLFLSTFVFQVTGQTTQLVDVGGHKLEAVVAGTGTPVVVFEAGWGDDRSSWDAVFPMVAEFTTAVRYNRAGYGNSESGPEPRSPKQINQEMRAMLKQLGLSLPYILVGHSLGGLYVRNYYYQYPGEVGGLVLVDSSHERQFNEWSALDASFDPSAPDSGFTKWANANPPIVRIEGEAWLEVERVGVLPNARPLDDLPVYIFTADHPEPEDTSVANSEDGRQVWRNLHAELFKDVHHGAHIVTKRSNHQIQKEEPSLVVWAVRQAATSVRLKEEEK